MHEGGHSRVCRVPEGLLSAQPAVLFFLHTGMPVAPHEEPCGDAQTDDNPERHD